MRLIRIFDDILERLSRWGLISCLLMILSLAVMAIFFRWGGKSFMWLEPLVRHLVFLSAFLGGSLATSKNVHIKVDILTKLVEMSSSRFIRWLHRNMITLFCCLTMLVLLKSSYEFYLSEKEFGSPAFLHIHSSYLVAIIPFGVGLILLRFINQLILGINGEQRDTHHV